MRYLTLKEILDLHFRILQEEEGTPEIRDLGALELALFQPRATFDGQDLYPDLLSKAATLCFSLVMNHPFVDGNKRIGHAAMETFLLLNGYEINATVDEQESIILDLASGKISRDDFLVWVKNHTSPLGKKKRQ